MRAGGRESPRFPVAWPTEIKGYGLKRQPVVGPQAKSDLVAIKAEEGLILAGRLGREIKNLLDLPLHAIAELIPDPPGVGPRYMVDLDAGYVAIYWIVDPPSKLSGAGPALWIERVVSRAAVEAALQRHAPAEEDPDRP
jgi:hypothetical protein